MTTKQQNKTKTPWPLVCKRTIPTEGPPHFDDTLGTTETLQGKGTFVPLQSPLVLTQFSVDICDHSGHTQRNPNSNECLT
jgi:hypothetical protein